MTDLDRDDDFVLSADDLRVAARSRAALVAADFPDGEAEKLRAYIAKLRKWIRDEDDCKFVASWGDCNLRESRQRMLRQMEARLERSLAELAENLEALKAEKKSGLAGAGEFAT